MRPRATLVLAWLGTGFAAVGGSIIGNAFGQPGLVIGAIIGGALGVVVAVLVATRFGWIASNERAGAIIGGWIGFAVAAPIAALNLHTPITPVASCALVGAGVLFGAGFARRG